MSAVRPHEHPRHLAALDKTTNRRILDHSAPPMIGVTETPETLPELRLAPASWGSGLWSLVCDTVEQCRGGGVESRSQRRKQRPDANSLDSSLSGLDMPPRISRRQQTHRNSTELTEDVSIPRKYSPISIQRVEWRYDWRDAEA
jgi:hypothetical protein